MKPTVTVSIVSFNGKQFLGRCLEAVLSQTYTPTDIVLFDNASQDGTIDFALNSFPTIRIISSLINLGFGAGHNAVIRKSQSDFILVLNQDAFLSPTFLEELITAMNQRQDVGIAGGKLLSLREDESHKQHAVDIIDMTWLDIEKKRRQVCYAHGQPDQGLPSLPTLAFAIDGAAMLLRRSMLADIEIDGQFFDEDFFAGKEDLDISWRAQLCGWKCLFVPSAIGHHLRTFSPKDKRARISDALKTSSIRNRYLLMIKNDCMAHLLRHIAHIVSYEIKIMGYVLLYERSSLSGYAQALMLLPKALKKRRAIMSRKKVANQYILHWFRP